MKRPEFLFALVLFLTAVRPAWAAGSDLVFTDAWMRYIMPSRPAAGYVTVANDGDKDAVLTDVSSPACGSLMLHRSVNRGGVETMEMADSVTVPAHGRVAFAPGGYHLMCEGPSDGMKVGATVAVTFAFADGGSRRVDFPVRNAVGKSE